MPLKSNSSVTRCVAFSLSVTAPCLPQDMGRGVPGVQCPMLSPERQLFLQGQWEPVFKQNPDTHPYLCGACRAPSSLAWDVILQQRQRPPRDQAWWARSAWHLPDQVPSGEGSEGSSTPPATPELGEMPESLAQVRLREAMPCSPVLTISFQTRVQHAFLAAMWDP